VNTRLLTGALLSFIMGLGPTGTQAEPLSTPTGAPLLTVTGAITRTNSGDAAVFDLAMLDALPQRTTVTETPWYEGSQSFSGPLLSAILDSVGASGATTLKLVALNDYASDLPASDAKDFPVILASRVNGGLMSVRDKGPLFVIYPFDEHPGIYNEIYFGRSVWQVSRMAVND